MKPMRTILFVSLMVVSTTWADRAPAPAAQIVEQIQQLLGQAQTAASSLDFSVLFRLASPPKRRLTVSSDSSFADEGTVAT